MIFGRELIKKILEDAPLLPGVYCMLNNNKEIIYVGKAKKLKKRLSNYLKPDLKNRIARMVHQTFFLEYIIAASEGEAWLIEAQFIRKYQPYFNILLKKETYLSYIELRLDHEYPQLIKSYGKETNSSKENIFGPFISNNQLDITLNELQKIFKLRPCTDSYFSAQKRPCLQYHIKKCFAPCSNKISKDDYMKLVNQVLDFLSGRNQELQEKLITEMKNLSKNNFFEEAIIIRDRLASLSSFQSYNNFLSNEIIAINTDIIIITESNNSYSIHVCLYRAGRIWGNKTFFPKYTKDLEKAEILDTFIGHFYQNRSPANEIITNCPLKHSGLIINSLYNLYGIKVKIIVSPSGSKSKLLKNACAKAKSDLISYLSLQTDPKII